MNKSSHAIDSKMSPTMRFMNELNGLFSKQDLLRIRRGTAFVAPTVETMVAVTNLVRAGLEILQSNPELTHVNIERGSIVGFR